MMSRVQRDYLGYDMREILLARQRSGEDADQQEHQGAAAEHDEPERGGLQPVEATSPPLFTSQTRHDFSLADETV